MKFPLFCICIVLLSCNSPQPSNTSTALSAEETTIAKDLIQGAFDDLWGGMDSTKILNYHTSDFIILEHGEVWDNNRIKQWMKEQLENTDRAKRVNSMDYISIEKYGQSIQMAYHNKAEFYRLDSLVNTGSWLESAVAVETPEGWRLKMMHSTWNKK